MNLRTATFTGSLMILALVLCEGCSKRTPEETSSFASSPALAWIGHDTLSLAEYETRFRSTPHVGQGFEAVEGYLHALLTEKMLADLARSETTIHSPGMEALIEQLHCEAVVEELLERELRKTPPISSSLLRDHMARLDRDLLLNAWVFRDSLAAYHAWHKADTDVPFSALGNVPQNGGRYINRQPLSYDEASPEFESLAYSLEPGEIGEPLFVDGSWWMIQLEESRPSAASDSLRTSDKTAHVRRVLSKRSREAYQNQFIAELMIGRSVIIEPEPFLALTKLLAEILPVETTNRSNQAPLTASLNLPYSPSELARSSELDLDAPLVNLKGFAENVWTTGDVLERLAVSPRPLHPAEEPLLARRLKGEILFLAEFETLYEQARTMQLDTTKAVRLASAIWRDHVHAQTGLRLLAKQVGTALPFEAPDTWDDASMAQADSIIVKRLAAYADSLGMGVNMNLLRTIDTSEKPVVLRKTHFPNRPMYPMPVGYRWGVLWAQQSD